MPKPEILATVRKSQFGTAPEVSQWIITIRLKRGWLWWRNRLPNCRLYLIRKDFGKLDSNPEGIWLKWIEDGKPMDPLAITLVAGRTYEAIVLVRDSREGTAYIANERFIETNGIEKRWPLNPGRNSPPNDAVGRFTFWLEVGIEEKAWRSKHFYAIRVPPAGISNDDFTLQTLYERKAA